MKIELILDDEYEFYQNRCDVAPTPYDLGITYHIDEEHTLDKFLADATTLNACINACLDKKVIGFLDEQQIKALLKIKTNPEAYLKNIEYVRLAFSNLDYLEYIKNTPILNTKKIVLTDFIDIKDLDRAKELIDKYSDYKDKIYIDFVNNFGYTKLEDAYNTINSIKKESEEIIRLGLSPIETIMYTYDKVRERVYNEEDENEDNIVSRNLTNVLTGDKIVCTGYAELFKAILDYIGIDNKIYDITLKSNGLGHSRNVVYIKDDKYDIDGLYFFDCTFDSQQENNNNNYLGIYNYFAKTKQQVDKQDGYRFTYDDYLYLNPNMNTQIKDILDNEDYDLLEKKNIATGLNHTASLVLGKRVIDRTRLVECIPERYGNFDHEKLLEDVNTISDKINRPISAEVFIKVLNQVRKQEYYQQPDKYPYDIESIAEAYIRSNWKFRNEHLTSEEQILFYIFGNSHRPVAESSEDFKVFTQREEKIDKDISRVHLTKILDTYSKSRK